MEHASKAVIAREWIIFALSVGVGGHVAFGMVLHDPLQQRWQEMGWNSLFVGLFVYVAVQASRSIFLAIRSRRVKHDH